MGGSLAERVGGWWGLAAPIADVAGTGKNMDAPFFFVALAFILTHEMDAIKCREWRIFPLTSRLDDSRGYLVFTAVCHRMTWVFNPTSCKSGTTILLKVWWEKANGRINIYTVTNALLSCGAV